MLPRPGLTELWKCAAWATRPSFGEPQGHPRLAGRGPPHRRQDEWGQDPLIRVNPETCPQPPPSDSHPGCRGPRCPLPLAVFRRGSYNAHSLIRPTNCPPRHCDHREAEAASIVPEGSRAPRRVTHRPGFVCSSPGTPMLCTSEDSGFSDSRMGTVHPSGSFLPAAKPRPLSGAGEDPRMCPKC